MKNYQFRVILSSILILSSIFIFFFVFSELFYWLDKIRSNLSHQSLEKFLESEREIKIIGSIILSFLFNFMLFWIFESSKILNKINSFIFYDLNKLKTT